ncbi:MAG TPA: DUF6351 family protein [Aliidongia sp.]|nr:DUF6351 family protein [Aliidongia sp.]
MIATAMLAGLGMAPAASRADRDEAGTISRTHEHEQKGSRAFEITTVSARNDLVAGGQVLVRIGVSGRIPLGQTAVTLNHRDVTASFHPEAPGSHSLLGLVTGLRVGDNELAVAQSGRHGDAEASLELTDFPLTGPVTSGPHMVPYECRTVESGMGAPLDADCSASTRVDYFYRTTAKTFAPLPGTTGPAPADLAFTTTNDGHKVPYIVRVESGTINRTIYRIAMLDNPTGGKFVPGPGWNRKLVVSFGGGCDAEYDQGVNQAASALSDNELSRGFAFAISTELVNNLHCNAALQGEALMMLKQHFVEAYGQPKWTAGVGGSGGAIQQYLITEMFPGLLDGLQPDISFPDSQLMSVLECRLLINVYKNDPATWTEAKQDAVNGYSPTTCASWAGSFGNTDLSTTGVSAPPCGLDDQSLVFNPVTNPGGARCDVQDMQVNVLGRSPKTGFARIDEDNVGVQYGLGALNKGAISFDEFIKLNQQVGGFDVNGNIVSQRSVGDPVALQRIYQSGLLNGGAGGLARVAILTQRTYFDLLANANNIHDRFEDFVIRARLQRANGRSDNQVIWTTGPAGVALGHGDTTLGGLSLDTMNEWLDNIAADPRPLTTEKIVHDKPAAAVDACFDAAGNKIVEPASLGSTGQCNTLYPTHSQPRIVAGMPVTNDIKKCQLKPIDFRDYPVGLSSAQKSQLRAVFPEGVCDYSKPGVGQVPLIDTYLRFSMRLDGDGRFRDDD